MRARRKAKNNELSMRPQALDAFIAYLRVIAPNPDQEITPKSHLIDDLDFDPIAFTRLGLLVYEEYGIGGLSPGSLRSENLTVERFFEHCILHVLGVIPKPTRGSNTSR